MCLCVREREAHHRQHMPVAPNKSRSQVRRTNACGWERPQHEMLIKRWRLYIYICCQDVNYQEIYLQHELKPYKCHLCILRYFSPELNPLWLASLHYATKSICCQTKTHRESFSYSSRKIHPVPLQHICASDCLTLYGVRIRLSHTLSCKTTTTTTTTWN